MFSLLPYKNVCVLMSLVYFIILHAGYALVHGQIMARGRAVSMHVTGMRQLSKRER